MSALETAVLVLISVVLGYIMGILAGNISHDEGRKKS